MSPSDVAQLYKNLGKPIPEELGVHMPAAKAKEKYRRIKKELDGITFDSSIEAEAYQVLKLMASCDTDPEIGFLKLQPEFILQEGFRDTTGKWRRAVKYRADFEFVAYGYRPMLDRRVVVDVKGIQTPAFRIKEKLFRQKFPDIDLQIWDRARVKEMSRC